ERDYVVAAISLGCSPARIIVRHILRNAALPLATMALLILPTFLLLETTLSFLTVGLQEPDASWGSLLTSVDRGLFRRGHALAELSPAIAITLFVFGVRLLGDGLEKERREREGFKEYIDYEETKETEKEGA
ncbi:MAG TPA: ABC transporter permease subunit, partial [Blastocatellia bacterium]|nr:ABC transporter permease subunit [Blastocatellia bacterium]